MVRIKWMRGKWSDLLDYAWRVADKDERDALEAARKEFYRDDFNERVMKRLAGEEVKEEVSPYIVKQNAAGMGQQMQNSVLVGGGGSGGTWTAPNGIYGSQMALQNSMLGQAQVRQEGAPVGGVLGLGKLFWR